MFVLLDLGFLHFISYWKRCTHSKGAMKKRKDKRSIEVLKCYDFHLEKKKFRIREARRVWPTVHLSLISRKKINSPFGCRHWGMEFGIGILGIKYLVFG